MRARLKNVANSAPATAHLTPFTSETARLAAAKPRAGRVATVRLAMAIGPAKRAMRAECNGNPALAVVKAIWRQALDNDSPHCWKAREWLGLFDPEWQAALLEGRQSGTGDVPRIVISMPNAEAPRVITVEPAQPVADQGVGATEAGENAT